jgi:carbamoyltransferase
MIVLGISALDSDATVALLDGERILFALAEERLSRVKNHKGFPHRALEEALRRTGVRLRDVDAVAYPFFSWPREGLLMSAGFARDLPFGLLHRAPPRSKAIHLYRYLRWLRQSIGAHRAFRRELRHALRQLGLDGKLVEVEHHHAHAASAFYTSGFERALLVTLDWYGGGLAGSVSTGGPEGIQRIADVPYPHSLGMFYADVTSCLGFRPNRHEGKIVGLAAYGDPEKLLPEVLARFRREPGRFRYRSGMNIRWIKALCQRHSRENVAAAFQRGLEVVATGFIGHHVRATGLSNVALAGGVAANVKLNQRVAEIPGVRELYVHPDMGDGGTGLGAALAWRARQAPLRPFRLPNVFLGPSYGTDELRAAVERFGLRWERCADIADRTAELLARGEVVARFDGGVEYGPRALGNRSILYRATEPGVNDWLNRRLQRSEFMPFAPAVLAEHAERCFHGLGRAAHAAEFMTVTFSGTDWFRSIAPAAVHVDGTARPQIVHRDRNPGFHAVLEAYHRRTGHPVLINTSFNMHEEPIVGTPVDALRAFRQSRLGWLTLGDLLVSGDAAASGTARAERAHA